MYFGGDREAAWKLDAAAGEQRGSKVHRHGAAKCDWEEDDIIVSGQKLHRGGREKVTPHSLARFPHFLYIHMHVTLSESPRMTHPNMSDCLKSKMTPEA